MAPTDKQISYAVRLITDRRRALELYRRCIPCVDHQSLQGMLMKADRKELSALIDLLKGADITTASTS